MPELFYSKVKELANNHGMDLRLAYSLDGYVKFIEVITDKYQEPFMVYVQSKYDIKNDEAIELHDLEDRKPEFKPEATVQDVIDEPDKDDHKNDIENKDHSHDSDKYETEKPKILFFLV